MTQIVYSIRYIQVTADVVSHAASFEMPLWYWKRPSVMNHQDSSKRDSLIACSSTPAPSTGSPTTTRAVFDISVDVDTVSRLDWQVRMGRGVSLGHEAWIR